MKKAQLVSALLSIIFILVGCSQILQVAPPFVGVSTDASLSSVVINGKQTVLIESATHDSLTQTVTTIYASTSIVAIPSNGKAKVSLSQSSPIALSSVGATKELSVSVTAEDGTKKTYKIILKRVAASNDQKNANLSSVVSSDPSKLSNFTFTENTITYNLTSKASSVTLTATPSGAGATIEGGNTKTVTLEGDTSKTITFKVTSESGAQKTYTFNISLSSEKDINTYSLLLNGTKYQGTINGTTISVTLPFGSPKTGLTPEISVSDDASYVPKAQNDFSNPVIYTVTALNGTTKTYTVNVGVAQNNQKDLTSFSIKGEGNTVYDGTISGNAISVTNVPFSFNLTNAVAVFATTGSQVKVNNVVQATGTTPNNFSNSVTYTVVAGDGSTKDYTVTVTKNPADTNNNLASLIVSSGTLSPNFVKATTTYNVEVDSTVSSITITGEKESKLAKNVTNSGTPVALGEPGTTKQIILTVTAEDDSTKDYTVNVYRKSNVAKLATLSTTAGTLTPAFSPDTKAYTVNIPSSLTSLSINATAATKSVIVSGTGAVNNIPLGTTSRTILLTAEDGSSHQYTVDIKRYSNNISSISGINFSPAFDKNTTSYVVDVGSSTSSITLSCVLEDGISPVVFKKGSTIQPSGTIALDSGENTIAITVSPPVGDSKTYTIVVNRAIASGGSGVVYYVSTSGDDANSGTSPSQAWKTLKKVNEKTFNPGDTIAFKGGEVWNGQLWPKGSGTSGNPIKLTSYGTGRPRIDGNGTGRGTIDSESTRAWGEPSDVTTSRDQVMSGAIQLIDQEYWIIENFEITNARDNFASNRSGIFVYNSIPENKVGGSSTGNGGTSASGNFDYIATDGMQYLHDIIIRNNYIHDVDTMGSATNNFKYTTKYGNVFKHTGGIIALAIPVDHKLGWKSGGNRLKGYDAGCGISGRMGGFDNLIIENNFVKDVGIEGVRTKVAAFSDGGGEITTAYPYANKNVYIRGNYIEDVFGDALVIGEQLENGRVEANYINGHSMTNNEQQYFAGIWTHYTKDTILRYNEVANGKNGNSDGQAIDVDNQCHDTILEYNYLHSNNHGMFMHMDSAYRTIVRYNVSINDGKNNSGGNGFMLLRNRDSLEFYNNTVVITSPVNNFFYANTPPLNYQNNIFYIGSNINAGSANTKLVENNWIYVPNGVNANTSFSSNQISSNTYGVDPGFVKTFDEIKAIEQQHQQKNQFAVHAANDNRPYMTPELLRERVSMIKLKDEVNGVVNPARNAGVIIRKPAPFNTFKNNTDKDIFGNALVGAKLSVGAFNNPSEIVSIRTISFDTNGGSSIEASSVMDGQLLTRPSSPSKGEFIFAGWYTGFGGTGNAYDFNTPVSSNFTLYAKWLTLNDLNKTDIKTNADTYLRSGSNRGPWGNAPLLQVKRQQGNVDYSRDLLLRFNLGAASFDLSSIIKAEIVIDIATADTARVQQTLGVWVANNTIASSWNEATFVDPTNTDDPGRGTKIGEAIIPAAQANIEMSPSQYAIDITSWIKSATKENKNFLLNFISFNDATKEMYVYSKENPATQGDSPARLAPTLRLYTLK